MRAPRARCGICERSRPEDDTILVGGRRAGNYRRSTARAQRRVCRECVEERVEYVRRAQADNLNVPLNDHYVSWASACDRLGIDVSDLFVSEADRRRRENQK